MIGEDDRLVAGEQPSKSRSLIPCGCSVLRLQGHEIDDVDDANFQFGQCCRNRSTAASVSSVGTSPAQAITTSGSAPSIVAGPSQIPMPASQWRRGRVHGQPLRRRLLAGDDHVDVVVAAQAVVGDREQRIGIGRQVDADDIGLLVGDEIDEAGILMAEAVVVLPPDMGGQEIVERGDRSPPGNARARPSATWRAG